MDILGVLEIDCNTIIKWVKGKDIAQDTIVLLSKIRADLARELTSC